MRFDGLKILIGEDAAATAGSDKCSDCIKVSVILKAKMAMKEISSLLPEENNDPMPSNAAKTSGKFFERSDDVEFQVGKRG